jgi:hypothetical protein
VLIVRYSYKLSSSDFLLRAVLLDVARFRHRSIVGGIVPLSRPGDACARLSVHALSVCSEQNKYHINN